MTFDYSIVIRTLGNAGEKYLQMLQAINSQTVKPREIVVVIPHGYSLDHTLGNERVVYSDKGMVTQRAVGIAEAQGEYLLVLDDDLDFPCDFAEKLYQTLHERHLDCVLAFPSFIEGRETIQERRKTHSLKLAAKKIRGAFTGQVFYSTKKSEWFDVITSTAGHRTYINCEDKPCQTGCFQCFFVKNAIANAVRFREETWLEQGQLSSYAAYDDAVFFYKLYLLGGRIAYTSIVGYAHLDAAVGRMALNKLESKRIRLYTLARNRTIFWHRHIWSNHRSTRNLLGGIYGIVNYAIYNIIVNLYPKYWPAIAAMFRGYHDAFQFIKNK